MVLVSTFKLLVNLTDFVIRNTVHALRYVILRGKMKRFSFMKNLTLIFA